MRLLQLPNTSFRGTEAAPHWTYRDKLLKHSVSLCEIKTLRMAVVAAKNHVNVRGGWPVPAAV